jgi:hypothetical protein
MSGPKVVRIVTREEIEAICRRQIASAEDTAAELQRCAKRHDAINDALTADLERRLRQLRRLFEQNRWAELQKQAPLTIAFLKTETEQIRVRAIAAAEAARSKGRRVADAAKTIISAMKTAGHEPSVALRNVALRATLVEGRELMVMEALVSENYTILATRRESAGASKEQLELASRLGLDEKPQSFTEWLAAHSSKVDQRNNRLDKLMAELETAEDAEFVQPFRERAAAIAPKGRRVITRHG